MKQRMIGLQCVFDFVEMILMKPQIFVLICFSVDIAFFSDAYFIATIGRYIILNHHCTDHNNNLLYECLI